MSTEKVQATPRPWRRGYQDNQVIYSDYKQIAVIQCREKEWQNNAELIVRAVNSHDATKLENWKKLVKEYKDISWLWYRVLDSKEKKEFESALVREKHPLAYEVGTSFWRFEQFCNQSK